MLNNNPIGIFDSGLGGLTVRAAIADRLPNESLIYFGDGLNVPYGGKTRERITAHATEAVERLLERGAKMIVVACNSATGASIDVLRERFSSIPVVGMEPAVKPAALSTKTGAIGVLATRAALDGELYRRTAARFRNTVRIIEAVGEGFVELVESEEVDSAAAPETVRRIVEPLLAQNVDRIVLGCTHYPYLVPQIGRAIDDWNAHSGAALRVEIVDSAPAIARRVDDLLTESDLLADGNNVPRHEFLTFGTAEYADKLRRIASRG